MTPRFLNTVAGLGCLACLLNVVAGPNTARAEGPGTGGARPTRAVVSTGLDVLEAEQFLPLRGRRVGLVCNQTAVDRCGRHIIDLMAHSPNVHLVSLFSPEHGIRGKVDHSVDSSRDSRTGLPIHSLYNERLPAAERYRPTEAMLRGIDTLVYDIQGIGVRYYTYITTLGYVLEAAARYHLRVIVLDRPNPLGGWDVEGPDLDLRYRTFAGYYNMPILHGMTVGELARLFNTEKHIGADLQVVSMQNWRRSMRFEETGLPWICPSPNIRSPLEAALYPGVGYLEDLPLSVGRGTPRPFEVVGAPWINGAALAEELNAARLPGAEFAPVHFTPSADNYAGEQCHGIRITVIDRQQFRACDLGVLLASVLSRLYPSHVTQHVLAAMTPMVGNRTVPEEIAEGRDPEEITRAWSTDDTNWERRRQPFLLYD